MARSVVTTIVLVLFVSVIGQSVGLAGQPYHLHPHHRRCRTCLAPCVTYKLVERTVMVPQITTQTRTVQVVECRPELRQREVTRYQRIPEKRTVTRQCVIMVPQRQTRQITQTVLKPVWEEVTEQCTVMVPGPNVDCCGQRVCKPELRTRTFKVCRMIPQQQTRQVSCTVYVPKTVSKTFVETSYQCVAVQQMVSYTVMVPYTVEKTITAPVCRMTPKTITCRVAVPCEGCPDCRAGCRGF